MEKDICIAFFYINILITNDEMDIIKIMKHVFLFFSFFQEIKYDETLGASPMKKIYSEMIYIIFNIAIIHA